MSDTSSSAYDQLRAAVERLLPADASGVRRPVQRQGARTYWEIGRLLNEHISGRAAYGQRAIARLADDLGVLPRTLYRARNVHQRLPADAPALERLSWSHCRLLVTIDDDDLRSELVRRALDDGWSVRRLQAALKTPDGAPPPPVRPGAVRVVDGAAGLALDLGFGVRRPLTCLAIAGKKTRRLAATLASGDTVELSTDDKGRPFLRRLWGRTEPRLHAYALTTLEAVGDGVVSVEIDLGLEVLWRGRCRLRPPAQDLPHRHLAAAIAAASSPALALCHRSGAGWELDVFGLSDTDDLAQVATRGQHLNSVWAADRQASAPE